MGSVLLREAAFFRIINESEYADHFCLVSSHFLKRVFTFEQLSLDTSYKGSIMGDGPDEYSLIFGNCQPEFMASVDVHTEMYNVEGGEKDFLPSGQTQLPILYFLFLLVYVCFFVTWIYVCIKKKETVHKLHIRMAAMLMFKALKMICASEDIFYVKRTGTPHGWDIAFYVFGFFKGVTLFTVIILVGTGWSFIKPFWRKEKKLLAVVIPWWSA